VISAVPIYFCPTRRTHHGQACDPFKQRYDCVMTDSIRGAPGDYAASIGTTGTDYPQELPNGEKLPPNGTFEARKGIRFAEVAQDGLSNTLLIGEKAIPQGQFGMWPWDCGIYDGHNPVCNTRAAGPGFPLATTRTDEGWKFGSWHPGNCPFAFADGSVKMVTNSIDPYVLGLLAQRNDGLPIPQY
jgi:prepilin-type processing-associated H-X9-DG protein